MKLFLTILSISILIVGAVSDGKTCSLEPTSAQPTAALVEKHKQTVSHIQTQNTRLRLMSLDKSSRKETLKAIAQQRKQLMLSLMTESPREFIKAAFKESSAALLPTEIQSDVEKPVETEGYIEAWTEYAGSVQYFLQTKDKKYTLHFVDRKPAIDGTVKVHLKGFTLDDHLLSDATQITPVKDSSLKVASATAPASETIGDQKTVFILVNLLDLPTQPYTVATVKDLLFNSPQGLNAYYYENSFHQTTISGPVLGWYTVPLYRGSCSTNSVIKEAIAKADPVIHFPDYTRVVVMISGGNCLDAAGRSTIGRIHTATADGDVFLSQAAVTGGSSTGPVLATLAHEYGHSLGVHHANSLDCGTVALKDSGCIETEYGDGFDVMGFSAGTPRHFNAGHKDQLHWFSPSALIDLENADNGTYTLAPIELPTSTPVALKILKTVDTTGWTKWYYAEYRQPIGFDNFSKTYIHLATNDGEDQTQLLDMTPATNTFSDAALPLGSTFTGPDGISIKSISETSNGSTLQVSVPPDTTAPKIGFGWTLYDGLAIGHSEGPYNVSLEGSDNRGFSEIELYKDGVLLGTKNVPPFTFAWDVNSEPEGSYQLKARAVDTANNVGESTITVTVDRTPPTVHIDSPVNGSLVEGLFPVTVSTGDSADVFVRFFVGEPGNLKLIGDTGSSSQFIWDTRQEPNGVIKLFASAIDQAGNTADSSPVQLTLYNSQHIPIMDPIGSQKGKEGEPLVFTISVVDFDGDALTYWAENLPTGASFDPGTHTFSWIPSFAQGGDYNVTFHVSDGQFSKEEMVVISINHQSQNLAISDNFDRPDSSFIGSSWKEEAGDFMIKLKKLTNAPSTATQILTVPYFNGTNIQSIAADFTRTDLKVGGTTRLGLILRYKDPKNYCLFFREMGKKNRIGISKIVNGVETELISKGFSTPAKNKPFRLEATTDGMFFNLKINGATILDTPDLPNKQGSVGIFVQSYNSQPHQIDNVVATAQD